MNTWHERYLKGKININKMKGLQCFSVIVLSKHSCKWQKNLQKFQRQLICNNLAKGVFCARNKNVESEKNAPMI